MSVDIDFRVAEREARLGLERVYETDVLWHYAPRADTLEYEWRGAFLWRYDGQVTYSDDPPPEEGPTVYAEPELVLTGPEFDPETYYFGERYDRYGRRWVVEDFDLEAIEAELAAAEVDGDEGAAVDPFTVPGLELNPDAGTEYLVELTSWDIQECDAERAIFTHNGNGPISEVDDTDYSALDEKVVFVQIGTKVCAGAVVGPNAVLTAAHCVTNANHDPYTNYPIDVCTHENLEVHNPDGLRASCHEAIEVLPCPQWANSTTYSIEHDYALVFLEHDISDETGVLVVNGQSDGTINGREDRILGFPVYEDDGACGENWEDDDCLTPSNERPGRELWTASGDIQSTPSGWIKWDTSFAKGMSGAPHLTCTTNAQPCTDANTRLSGIQATHEMCNNPPCGSGWAGGPKGKDIKAWVEAHEDDFPPDPEPCPSPDEAAFVANPPQILARLDPAAMSPTCADPNGYFAAESVCGDTVVYGGTLGPPNPLDACGAAAGTMKEQLVVFLPGLDNTPDENGYVLAMAAFAGYRTIGLSYANFENSNNWCIDHAQGLHEVPTNPDDSFMDCKLNYRDECPYWARKEHITGVDHPETDVFRTPAGALAPYYDPFPVPDSLAYRLYYALVKLHELDQQMNPGGPGDCGWDTFFDTDDGNIQLGVDPNTGLEEIQGWGTTEAERMGAIAWDKIILAGFSNGANDTGLIALENEVAGFFVIDAPTDLCLTVSGDDESGRAATFYTALVDDVVEPSNNAPRFGVYHRNADPGPAFEVDPDDDPDGDVIEARPVTWDAYEVGTGANRIEDHKLSPLSGLMMAECEDQVWDAEVERTEAGGPGTGAPLLKQSTNRDGDDALKFRTMTIRTDQIPPDVNGCGEHASLAESSCMPRAFSDGVGNDDRAMTPAEANLFEAYVTAFCELGEGQ